MVEHKSCPFVDRLLFQAVHIRYNVCALESLHLFRQPAAVLRHTCTRGYIHTPPASDSFPYNYLMYKETLSKRNAPTTAVSNPSPPPPPQLMTILVMTMSLEHCTSSKSRRTHKEVGSNKRSTRDLAAWKRIVGFKVHEMEAHTRNLHYRNGRVHRCEAGEWTSRHPRNLATGCSDLKLNLTTARLKGNTAARCLFVPAKNLYIHIENLKILGCYTCTCTCT